MGRRMTVQQLLAEAAAATPFMAMEELAQRIVARPNDFIGLDVRERDAWEKGRIPSAQHLARGQLELKVDDRFPDPALMI